MSTISLILGLLAVSLVCGFLRTSLARWTIAVGVTLLAFSLFGQAALVSKLVAWLGFAVMVFLNRSDWRQLYVTKPVLGIYRKMVPKLSETEQIALEAGTVGWEGELFAGKPDYKQLLDQPVPELSAEERAFLEGPVEELCSMIDDWEITHELADLTPEIWDFLKREKFFGMIIPRQYGGLGYSARTHSLVLQKIASKSATVSSTVAVPNSLGPGELLMHYGTEEQKNHYLPRLAKGEEIPCFGLTGPTAGSDATSIPDTGVVCKGQWEGEEVVGLMLNFDKRYITLAPVATVIGLAFQMKDPDGLLGDQEDIGISLALLPRDTKGMEIGKRHFPLNIPFQNGPIRGKDVFVPLDYLIGGVDYSGQGWRMLVECLSVGRAISLPSSAAGGMKAGSAATGAYARIRKQFGLPIGRFEGVEEAMARIGGYTYATSALTRATAAAVDRGEKPAVPSAIAKYHATEMGAAVAKDTMDIHGGKGVILGPKNYAGRAYQSAPISITVEGANIMTRSLMIFGQGAIRCHPYVLKELEALQMEDPYERLVAFDKSLFGHIGVALSNASRAFLLGLSNGRLAQTPGDQVTKKYYQHVSRYSAALGLVADMAMLTLGGKLKFKERLSARLGDILSQLYIVSAMLKRYEDQRRPKADIAFLTWACEDAVYKMQTALSEFLRNYPIRPIAWLLKLAVFPLGRWSDGPTDRMGHKVAALLMNPNEATARLIEGAYLADEPNNPVGQMLAQLPNIIKAEPIERKIVKAVKAGEIDTDDPAEQLDEALQLKLINDSEHALLSATRAFTWDVISVDEFDPEELRAAVKSERLQRAAA